MSEIIVSCPNCGTKNKIPNDKIHSEPKCGKCKCLLPSITDRPVDISDATFEKEVLQSSLPVFLDCWAGWCEPCKMMAPILDELAKEYAGRIKFAKLDTEEYREIPSQFNINSIPTMLLFRDGKHVDTIFGAFPKKEIESRIQQLL